MKHVPTRAWRVGMVLARIELHLILEATAAAIGVEHQGSSAQCSLDEPFCAHNHRDRRPLRRLTQLSPRAFQKFRVRWRRRVAQPAISRHKTFRETHHARARSPSLRNGPFRRAHRLFRAPRNR